MGEQHQNLEQDAQEALGRAKGRARRAAEGVAAEADAVGEQVREAAGGFADDMRGAADSLIHEQKARVADMAQGFAQALRRSADAFAQEGGGGPIAHYADSVAERVEQLSDTVRRQHWRDTLATVEDAARQRPELFFIGAVAAGFVMGRMLTAGAAAPRRTVEPTPLPEQHHPAAS
jgi:hypothetical protein